MVQPRRASAWLLLCVLACLFVLSMASPRLWDHAARSPAKPDLLAGQAANMPHDAARAPRAAAIRSSVYAAPCPPPPALLAAAPVNPIRDEDETESRDPLEGTDSECLPAGGAMLLLPTPADDAAVGPAQGPALAQVPEDSATEKPPHCDGGALGSGKNFSESVLVTPADKIGAQTTVAEEKQKAAEPENCPPPAPSESIRRLPVVVANIPSPIRATPHEDVQPPKNSPSPDANQPHVPLPAAGISAPACRA